MTRARGPCRVIGSFPRSPGGPVTEVTDGDRPVCHPQYGETAKVFARGDGMTGVSQFAYTRGGCAVRVFGRGAEIAFLFPSLSPAYGIRENTCHHVTAHKKANRNDGLGVTDASVTIRHLCHPTAEVARPTALHRAPCHAPAFACHASGGSR